MKDPASTLEHVASAMNGSDSSDWLGALAMAQAAPGGIALPRILEGVVDKGAGSSAVISGLGAGLTRLQTTTSRLTFSQARDSLLGLVRKLNAARRWRLSEANVGKVAESALLLHLHPTCPYCNGQKHAVPPCVRCDGSGNRALPKRHTSEVAYVLNVLEIIQGLTERAVSKRMR